MQGWAEEMLAEHQRRMIQAHHSLLGLSVGDAFGGQFFGMEIGEDLKHLGTPPGSWSYTDDTVMGLAVTETLESHWKIDQDHLAALFARKYWQEPDRGYGHGAHQILGEIVRGRSWKFLAPAAFGGTGSMGNGSAMRAAPVGAYFHSDIRAVISNATLSAAVTHAHPEGAAGAVAVAVAAAQAVRVGADPKLSGISILDKAWECTPAGETRLGLEQARAIPRGASVADVVAILGNGQEILCQDTVPFALWCAAVNARDFARALWVTASGGGDVDTTCAISGSVAVLSAGRSSIPREWLSATEKLPVDAPAV